jgi:hypothetical protein
VSLGLLHNWSPYEPDTRLTLRKLKGWKEKKKQLAPIFTETEIRCYLIETNSRQPLVEKNDAAPTIFYAIVKPKRLLDTCVC